MKAATKNGIARFCGSAISIHAAREGGDVVLGLDFIGVCRISIHAAREGGDLPLYVDVRWDDISIHAAREGGDHRDTERIYDTGYFNPRRP